MSDKILSIEIDFILKLVFLKVFLSKTKYTQNKIILKRRKAWLIGVEKLYESYN